MGTSRPHELRFLETTRFVEDGSESQGSRFQDHRSYSGVGLAACMHICACRRGGENVPTCERMRDRTWEGERGGRWRRRAANQKYIRRPLSATSLSTSRSRTGIAMVNVTSSIGHSIGLYVPFQLPLALSRENSWNAHQRQRKQCSHRNN